MSNYQVADTVIRIKNAAAAHRKKVVLPYSRMNKQIALLLVKEKFLSGMTEEVIDDKKAIVIGVAYEKRTPMLTGVEIVSKPSLRVYTKAKNLSATRKVGTGTTIVSTSKGVMTEKEAVKQLLGGEVLFRIW